MVELLICISFSAILFSLFFPSLRKTINLAQQMECQSNFKQIGIAIDSFATDHSYYPQAGMTSSGLDPSTWMPYLFYLIAYLEKYLYFPNNNTYTTNGKVITACPTYRENYNDGSYHYIQSSQNSYETSTYSYNLHLGTEQNMKSYKPHQVSSPNLKAMLIDGVIKETASDGRKVYRNSIEYHQILLNSGLVGLHNDKQNLLHFDLHVSFVPTYIIDSTFNADSQTNSIALWFLEN